MHSTAIQPSPAIPDRPFVRFDEIFDLVEKASALALPAFGRFAR
jgi:hypothetical protein